MKEYFPPLRINFNRPVEHEETTNLIAGMNTAQIDLGDATLLEAHANVPGIHVWDDLDADHPVATHMDSQWKAMVHTGIKRGRELLLKQEKAMIKGGLIYKR